MLEYIPTVIQVIPYEDYTVDVYFDDGKGVGGETVWYCSYGTSKASFKWVIRYETGQYETIGMENEVTRADFVLMLV